MYTETTAVADPEPIIGDRARPERSNGAAPEVPFDAGLAAPSFRLPKGLIARVLDAEVTAATSIWFSDELRTRTSPGLWAREAGPAALAVADPHALADPFVVAAAGLLAARTIAVGVTGVDVARRDPVDVARAAATIADFAPGRFVLGLRAGPTWHSPAAGPGEVDGTCVLYERIAETIEAVDRLVGRRPGPSEPGPIELVVEVPTVAGAELAGRFGVGWLPSSLGLDPDAYAAGVVAARRAAAEAGHGAAHLRFGLLVDAVVHEDPVVVADALDRHLVRAHIALGIVENGVVDLRPGTRRLLCDWANGEVSDARMHKLWATLLYPDCLVHGLHGRPDQIAARLQPYVDAGARRVVLRNLVGLGRPHEALAGERATAGTLRLARLRFDGAATT
jgi:phthiodiolone/phenolphthiodiolone dimycocerosates ketoreductase